jgi:putative transposase
MPRKHELKDRPTLFGVKNGRITVAVNPAYTSQQCSNCGTLIKKSLSTRTHICECGFVLDRDWNAAINILELALSTIGYVGTWVLNPNASGDLASTVLGASLFQQAGSYSEESPHVRSGGECQELNLRYGEFSHSAVSLRKLY